MDFSFAVHKLTKFSADPGKVKFELLVHLLGYIMHKIDWFEGGLNLSDIATNNVGELDLTPWMKYIMVRLDN